MSRRHPLLTLSFLFAAFSLSGSLTSPMETAAPAASPLDRVKPLVDARRFEEAERLSRQMLVEAAASHGEDSMECARALDALVHTRLAETDPPLEEVLRDAERAVTIKREVLGQPSLELATSVNNLGRNHLKMGNLDKALDAFEENARIREKLQGPHD